MLTRCPACDTRFRVTAEQLKARSGRVRCGKCQHIFSALDSLIEEPLVVIAPLTAEPPGQLPPVPLADAGVGGPTKAKVQELPVPEPTATVERPVGDLLVTSRDDVPEWTEAFPEMPAPPRRWPWVIGSVLALVAFGLQAALAFRVELAVLWPGAKQTLVALCEVADCKVELPARAALVGIEASDLHPDTRQPGRLTLTATLKSRAPFTQQFPHLELTLTDTADKAIARKVLAPTDYLPQELASTSGMQPNADFMMAVGIDPGEMAASGYRLYLFYP